MDDAAPFYSRAGLNVETTALRWADLDRSPVAGDVDFFVDLAAR